MRHRDLQIWRFGFLLCAMAASAQSALSTGDKEMLPPASMWENYSYQLQASGGIAPYHWAMISSSLPRTIQLREHGELVGAAEEAGTYEFTVAVRDSNNPSATLQKKFKFSVETPVTAEWERSAKVSGQRIDGSVKVSNRSGRDFDLTVIILAVNDIGRATAIGYQHFQLKRGTRDLKVPFGDTVSPGDYSVNVDVVGEEPISNRVFRSRLVTAKQAVTQGP